MTIDDALAEAVHNGLRGLTVWPTPDGRWQANTTFDGVGWKCETRTDAVEATRAALGLSAVSELKNDRGGGIFD